jgi:hypothetical protein
MSEPTLREPDQYTLKDLERQIGEDDRIGELGCRLTVRGGQIVVQGHLTSSRRRAEVLAVIHDRCPGCAVVDETTCAEEELSTPPTRTEEIT